MIFSAKKDAVYAIVIWSASIILLPILLFNYSLALLVIFIVMNLNSLWIWNSTSYKIENGELLIKSWLFRNRVKVKNIYEISKTKNVWSSYALAVERLKIKVRLNPAFYVSPNDFEKFIEELKKYNPEIKVK